MKLELCFGPTYMEDKVMELFGEYLGGSLSELVVDMLEAPGYGFHIHSKVMVGEILRGCPVLSKIHFTNMGFCGFDFYRMAPLCPNLRHLVITEREHSIDDSCMEMLFTNCSRLEEVHLEVYAAPMITQKTLQAILKHKLHLKKFTWRSSAIKPKDIAEFVRQAKRQQLLPVCQCVAV